MNRWTSLLQTGLLLGGMVALVAIVGMLVAGTVGLVLALGLGIALAGSGQAPPRLFLYLQGARPLSPFHAPGLHQAVDELARRAGLPRVPALYLLPSREQNAFTVGSPGDGAAVVLSDSLLRTLGPREIVGVVAHEVAHIRNGDTTVLSLARVVTRLTSAFATVGQLLLVMNIPMMIAGYAPVSWWLVLVLLSAPTVSALLLLGLSRTREFEADQEAARLTGDPVALARALVTMESGGRRLLRHVLAPGRVGGWSLLQTHPPTDARVRRLLNGRREDRRRPPRPATVPQEAVRYHDRVARDPRHPRQSRRGQPIRLVLPATMAALPVGAGMPARRRRRTLPAPNRFGDPRAETHP